MKKILLFLCFFIWFSAVLFSQEQITPYDKLPGNNSIYKPTYNENLPSWAKMLYQYPANFNEIEKAYKQYFKKYGKQKNPIIRYYKIWRKVVGNYADENGVIRIPTAEEIKSYTSKTTQQIQKLADQSNSDWSFLGPKNTFWLNEDNSSITKPVAPWQVNVYSFDVFKLSENILYAGTETGYINKSTDSGEHWTMLAKEYVFSAVNAVSIHPTNSNIVYASGGSQIHKTIDGGITWNPMLKNGISFSANHISIDSNNPNNLFVSTEKGIYISVDAGENWAKKTTRAAYDIEIKPGDSNTIYAITKNSSDNFELIISTNVGVSFSTVYEFPSTIHDVSGGLLATTASNPNFLLAVMLSSNNTPFLYKGTISTGNWTWSKVIDCNTNAFKLNNGQGYFDLVLEISPENENVYMVGTTTLFKTNNGGASFDAIGGYFGRFSIHPDIQDMKWLGNNKVWVATDGGMSYSIDAFETDFQPRINGLVGSAMWGFDQGWNEDIVVGGRYHNGNTAMADFYNDKALRMGGAESPTGWVLKGKSRHVAFNDLGGGWILPKTAEEKQEGKFIFSKYPNMQEYGGVRGNLIHHPNYFEILFLGEGNQFWKSDDMGESFTSLHTFAGDVLCVQMSITNPNVIYADVKGVGFYKSEDQGNTWVFKPALSSSSNGGSIMKGRTNIVISPYDENTVYACYSNGVWYANNGKVFKSTDGGDSWNDWSGSVNGYTKNLVIQPGEGEEDLVYLFITARKGAQSVVYYRKSSMNDWALFTNNYPRNFDVTTAMPFFRDGKLRLAGSGGVWETPLQEQNYKPIIRPWVEKLENKCMADTLHFDDHSILKHAGASWKWEISPSPEYVSDLNIRNPKVVLGSPGSYNVTLTVTVNGVIYKKTIDNMVNTTTCPSITDCDNPAELPKTEWTLLYADSQETNYPGLATMAFDDDPSTIWHTRWSTGTDPYPHEIQIDIGDLYDISKFNCLPRQDGSSNGRIKDYELYLSKDKTNWGEAVQSGTFENSNGKQVIVFDTPVVARYMRLKALSEINGNEWTSISELTLTGCLNGQLGIGNEELDRSLMFYPNPASNVLSIKSKTITINKVEIYSILGKRIKNISSEFLSISTDDLNTGIYIVRIYSDQGSTIRKLIKK